MSTLSPQAQAVVDAFRAELDAQIKEAVCGENSLVAAVLRAAVEQTKHFQYEGCFICGAGDLLAIAAELEAGG